MWFGTDNGVARFDGYEFKTFGYAEGLGNPVVFEIFEDSIGNLSFATMDGKLWIYDGETIEPWKYNYKVDSLGFGAKSASVKAISEDGWTTIADQNLGIVHVSYKGEVKIPVKTELIAHVLTADPNYVSGFCNQIDKYLALRNIDNDSFRYYYIFRVLEGDSINVKRMSNADGIGNSPVYLAAIDDYVLESILDTLSLYKNDVKIGQIFHSAHIGEIREGGDGVLEAVVKPGELRFFKSVKDILSNDYILIFSGLSCTDAYFTSDGGVWVTSIDKGIGYVPTLKGKTYKNNEFQSGGHVSSFAFHNGVLVSCYRDGKVSGLDLDTGNEVEYPQSWGKLAKGIIASSANNTKLYNGLSPLVGGQWSFVAGVNYNGDTVSVRDGASGLKLDLGNVLLFAAPHGIAALDTTLNFKYNLYDVNNTMRRAYDIAPTLDSGFYIGFSSGIAWQSDFGEPYVFLDIPHPSFNLRIQAIENVCGEFMAIGTKGLGVAVFTATDTVEIRKADGLTSDMIEDLYVDSECNVWVTTLSGLNKVTFTSLDSFRIQNFTIHHGLPSNEVTQVQEHNGEMWVATTKGLITLPEYEIGTFASKPMLVELAVNDQEVEATSGLSFAHDENSLRLEWLAIDYQQMGRVPYRYRLNEGDEWTYTQDRSVTYPQLSPDSYEFEVQRANRDGVWSESTAFVFTIKVPWWQTWWFTVLGLGVFVAAGIFVYKRQVKKVKASAGIQQKLVELERSALQAQMNPHFIFNCLSSVQNFILSNDTEQAVGYLSRFSRLVRQTLDASVEGYIFIEEEAQLLDNYLALEKQRFGEKFSYDLTIDPSLKTANARIPSMMTQPFVENAVIHGLAETNGAGHISVRYDRGDSKSVLVTIADNGPGISSTKESRAKVGHKSVGMTISQKRLEMMSQSSGVIVIDLAEESQGLVSGTKVELRLRCVS